MSEMTDDFEALGHDYETARDNDGGLPWSPQKVCRGLSNHLFSCHARPHSFSVQLKSNSPVAKDDFPGARPLLEVVIRGV